MRWFWLCGLLISAAAVAKGEALHNCYRQPVACLAMVDSHQREHQPESMMWWAFQEQRLEALFRLERSDQLYAALRPWLNNPDTPPEYQPVIASYYGKWLNGNDRHGEAQKVLAKSLTDFQRLYQQQASASEALKIVNLLVYLDRFEQAYQFANELTQRSDQSPYFYREVYAELGHIAYQQGDHGQHVHFRRQSVHWAEQAEDEQQRAVAYNNYAVALREAGQPESAKDAFIAALNRAIKVKDDALTNKLRLRLAELAKQQNQLEQAKRWIGEVTPEVLSLDQIHQLRTLRQSLNADTDATSPALLIH